MANPRLASNALLKPSERKSSQTKQISRYEILKDKIKTWWSDRFKVGEALREIRESKLYKQEYATFEDFSENEFGIKRTYAHRLIEAVDVKDSLKMLPIGNKIERESQARALVPVPAEDREKVIKKASKNGNITARTLALAAREVKEKKTQPVDSTRCAIPEEVLSDWREAEAFNETLKSLHRILLRIESGIEARELIFREINNPITIDLRRVWDELQRVLPFAVCTTCQGRHRTECTLCKGRGWLSKFAYEHFVSKKTREMREKAVAR